MVRKVFEPDNLGGIEVNSRFVRSACGSGIPTSDGYVTDNVIEWYTELAQGEIGLIITGMMDVLDDGNIPEGFLRIDNDSYMGGLGKITDAVHSNNSKIIAQIGNHGSLLSWEPKTQPLGPSKLQDTVSGVTAREMTKNDIENIVDQFVKAATRCKEVGFDGVQVHAAHGFLLSKFLSPYYNKRNDEYGGSIENRARIIVEILKGIKEKCGNDFPVFLKVNCSDFLKNDEGLVFEDSKKACKILSDAGYDAIEISGGIFGARIGPSRSGTKINEYEAYHKEFAEDVAADIETPVILVGGVKRLEIAEEVLQDTKIRAISLARALTFEPKLIKKWVDGDKNKSKCLSCNKCFATKGGLCIFNNLVSKL